MKKTSPALSHSQSSVKAAFPRLAYLCHSLLRPSCKARDGKLAVSGLAELFQRRWAACSPRKRVQMCRSCPRSQGWQGHPSCWATPWAMLKPLLGYMSVAPLGMATDHEGASPPPWQRRALPASPVLLFLSHVISAGPMWRPFSLAGYIPGPPKAPLAQIQSCSFPGADPGLELVWELCLKCK